MPRPRCAYSKFGASARQLLGDSMADPDMGAYPILTPDEAIAYVRSLEPDDELALHPLISGLPPEIAQEQLATFERHVLPHFAKG